MTVLATPGASAGAPDGRHVAITAGTSVIVAELPGGRVVKRLAADPVAIAFSLDGRWLCTVGGDGQILVFDARRWTVVRGLTVDKDVYHVQPTPTGLLRQAEAATVRTLTDAERRTYSIAEPTPRARGESPGRRPSPRARRA